MRFSRLRAYMMELFIRITKGLGFACERIDARGRKNVSMFVSNFFFVFLLFVFCSTDAHYALALTAQYKNDDSIIYPIALYRNNL